MELEKTDERTIFDGIVRSSFLPDLDAERFVSS